MNRVLSTSVSSGCNSLSWMVVLAQALSLALAPNFSAAELAAPSVPSPGATARTLVVLGDSLAAGYGLDPSEAFPADLQKQLKAAGLNYNVINAGVSGDTSAGALRRLDWILRRPLDVLLVEVGGNDGLRGQSTTATKTNLQSIIERTRKKYPQAQVILAGMRMPPNMGNYVEEFEKLFAEVAAEQKVPLVPFLLAGVGGVPELNLPDGIHPTPEGHRKVATNVFRVLKPILEKQVAGQSAPKENQQGSR